jgi:hypothetical protein
MALARNLLSKNGSVEFKGMIEGATRDVPIETNINSLDLLRKTIHNGEHELNNALEFSRFSDHQKETLEIYLTKFRELLSLVNARIDELESRTGGRRKSRRRQSRRRQSRRRKY